MAIQDFSSGPQNYFEPGYFNGDYTEPNVSRAFLQCDIDNIKGGRVVTGEYYLGNYIDGSYYHNNSSKATVTVTADKIINGNASMQDYFEPGYFVNGYIEPRSAKATVSCQVTRARNATATFVSEFQQTAQARLITDINLFAFGDAAITVQVSRIRGNNIAASTVFNVATDFVVKRNGDADVDAIFSAIIAGLRSRDFNLETQAAFSFVCSVETTKVFDSSLISQTSVSITANRFRDVAISATSTVTVSGSGDRLRDSAVTVNSEFLVSATARKIRDAHLTGTGVAAINCIANFITNGSASIQSSCTVFFNGGKRTLASSALTAFSGVSISRYVGSDRPKTLTGTFDSNFNNSLLNSATRPSNLKSLNSNSWYYQTDINVGFNLVSFSSKTLFYLPLGTIGGVTSYVTATIRYSGSTGSFVELAATLGPGVGGLLSSSTNVGPAAQTSSAGATIGISFTNGQKLAFYINGTRVAVKDSISTTNWVIPSSLDVAFAQSFPFTVTGYSPFSAYTNYAWLTLGNQTSGGSASASTSIPVNTDDTLFLYQFNNGNEDLGATLQGSASIQSQSVVSAVANKLIQANSSISSQFAVTAVIGTIEQTDLSAFSNAAVTTTVTRIKSLSSACDSTSAVTADVVVTRSEDVTVSANVSLSAESSRIRPFTADFTAIATQLTAVVRLAGLFADDLSEFVITASANKTGSAETAVSASSSLQATALKIKQLDSTLTAQVTLSAVGVSAKLFSAAISSEFAISATANRLRSSAISVVSNIQLSAVGNNLGKIESALFDSASVTANINKTASAVASISVVSTVNAVVARTRDTASSVNSSTAITADAQRVTTASAVFATVASQLSVAVEISGLQASMVTAVTLTADATRTRNFTANTATISQLTGAIGKNISLSAALTASSTCTINAGRSVSAQINIQSAMQFVAEVREIRLDNIVYVIPSETRVYVIKGETRIHRIREETRIYTI